jgi:hypothetical protein
MSEETVKKIAQSVIEQMPDDSSWEDIMRELYVWHAFDAGMLAPGSAREKKAPGL